MNTKDIIENYQCAGCVNGHNFKCYVKGEFLECEKHCPGTMFLGQGMIFLGLPKGFNRLGPVTEMRLKILSDINVWGEYDKYNIPVWKYLDEYGNTLVRGLQPRLNDTFLHIYIGDQRDKINCLEITNEDIEYMD